MSKPINEMGWDELVPGALYTFDGIVDIILLKFNKDRRYSETSSKSMSVGDWRVIKPVWNSETCIDPVKTVGFFSVSDPQLLQK